MDAAIYSDGTANGGKQITGLATAVPIVTNTGVYGGIDRATAVDLADQDLRRQLVPGRLGTQVSRRPSAQCSTTS